MRKTLLKLAAVAAPLAIAVSPLTTGAAHAAPSAPTIHPVTVTPSTHLVNGQVVTVSVKDFGDGTQVFATVCDSKVITSEDQTYCDQVPSHIGGGPETSGSASFQLTLYTGKNFGATNSGAYCGAKNPTGCTIIVSDGAGADAKNAGFGTISFGAKTKTDLKSNHKSVKAGKKVKLSAKVTGTKGGLNALTGKFVFKDGKKKFASKKVPASGKLTVTRKLSKAGTHKLTVSYTGNDNYLASTDKVTVKAKAKKK